MAIDLNEASEQRQQGAMIPDGTFVKLKGILRPGGATCPDQDPMDDGLFRRSNTSDAMMLDWEFTVMHGPHARRKLWQLTTVTGGQVDEKGQSKAGNISKSMFRAMVESALGIDPKDMSDEAKKKRLIRGLTDLNGIEFAAKIGIEKGTNGYSDKNRIAHVVVPGEPEWQLVMAGQEVEAKPSGAVAARPSAAAKPVWGNGAGAAQATPTSAAGAPAWVKA